MAQPIYQVLGPKYSENWFDLRGRTTATMIVALGLSYSSPWLLQLTQSTANPVGGALGQLISPLVGTTRQSVSASVRPACPLLGLDPRTGYYIYRCHSVRDSHPRQTSITPQYVHALRCAYNLINFAAYAASIKSPSLRSLVFDMVGIRGHGEARMTGRERLDFAIVILLFGVIVGMSVYSMETQIVSETYQSQHILYTHCSNFRMLDHTPVNFPDTSSNLSAIPLISVA